MSAPAFTPGPWEVHTSGLVRRCEGDVCCKIAEPTMPYRQGVGHARGFKEQWHNAHLIAAAPELYEAGYALREAQKAYMDLRCTGASDQQKNERGKAVADAAAVLDRALAKARGEA